MCGVWHSHILSSVTLCITWHVKISYKTYSMSTYNSINNNLITCKHLSGGLGSNNMKWRLVLKLFRHVCSKCRINRLTIERHILNFLSCITISSYEYNLTPSLSYYVASSDIAYVEFLHMTFLPRLYYSYLRNVLNQRTDLKNSDLPHYNLRS